jgi:predicted RNA-binding Zn ribbon-like protein
MAAQKSDSLRLNRDLEFRYIGGDWALDLVNTVDWTRRGPKHERLTDFDRLTRWAEGAGILSSSAATTLRAKARARPREAEAAYRHALRVRAGLQRLFGSLAGGGASSDALKELNLFLSQALERMRIVPAVSRPGRYNALRFGWPELGERLDSVIWPVLWSAASLVISAEAARIRVCEGPDCGWMYVDRSRNRLRRWCQMATCGTQEKSRRRARRSGVRR